MVDVTTSIEIAAPLERVSAYALDPDNAPKWYVNIKSAEWKTPKPLRQGSKVAFVAHFLGRKLSYTYEIVHHSATKLIMRTADGPFPMETTYMFTRISDNLTRMTLRNRGTPTGFSRLFSPFMAAMMRRANNGDLKLIKRILEQQG